MFPKLRTYSRSTPKKTEEKIRIDSVENKPEMICADAKAQLDKITRMSMVLRSRIKTVQNAVEQKCRRLI